MKLTWDYDRLALNWIYDNGWEVAVILYRASRTDLEIEYEVKDGYSLYYAGKCRNIKEFTVQEWTNLIRLLATISFIGTKAVSYMRFLDILDKHILYWSKKNDEQSLKDWSASNNNLEF